MSQWEQKNLEIRVYFDAPRAAQLLKYLLTLQFDMFACS